MAPGCVKYLRVRTIKKTPRNDIQTLSETDAPHASMPSDTARSSAAASLPSTSCTPPRVFAISSKHEA